MASSSAILSRLRPAGLAGQAYLFLSSRHPSLTAVSPIPSRKGGSAGSRSDGMEPTAEGLMAVSVRPPGTPSSPRSPASPNVGRTIFCRRVLAEELHPSSRSTSEAEKMSNSRADSPGDDSDPFLAEIRRLRGGREAEEGEDWVERAVDLKVDQLLDLSECLRSLDPSQELIDIRNECDGILEEMVTGRLAGEAAVERTDDFLCKTASVIMERLLGEIEEEP